MAAMSAQTPAFFAPNGRVRLGLPLAASVVFHLVLLALFFVFRPGPPPPSPPMYRVDLVAAPPGERAAGVVKPQPETPTPEPPPTRPKTAPRTMPVPDVKAPPRAKTPVATPTLPTQAKPDVKKPEPTAGGGETGGRGTDVVTVSTGGAEFPYPGYLENIVRQIALRFKPSSRGSLHAEVFFLIQRDGTVPISSIRLVTRSGVYAFDADAQGAVEAAANARRFGPLPEGYPNDALPVTFRFDPRLLR
jgi:outer membrane biosynthesis protein TonB